MDWTMIANSEEGIDRFRCLAYLLMERYSVEAHKAGKKFLSEKGEFVERDRLFDGLSEEIANPTASLSMPGKSDETVRRYLKALLLSYKG